MIDEKPVFAPITGEVEFHYRKSSHFRAIYAEGVYGGVTPRGVIHFALFNERAAIPKSSTMQVSDGAPQSEVVKQSLSGMVREVEVDVIMELGAALSFYHWLGSKVDELRRRSGISESDWAELNTATNRTSGGGIVP